ncbi:hypothetical protein ABZ671_18455 [Micromonospora sp. NPDC006766]|uniref:hypothetical protein n=1 Tax=Micromonospora sp. NPDC006766 TaxID=3154778 RepID=UPI0033D4F44A
MPDFGAIFIIVVITTVIYRAGRRGKNAVRSFYQGRIAAWKGSSPAPAPRGVKVGAALATGLVGGVLYTRGFVGGLVQGWPDGSKAAHDWYEARTKKEATSAPATKPKPTTEQPAAVKDPGCRWIGPDVPRVGISIGMNCGERIAPGAPEPYCAKHLAMVEKLRAEKAALDRRSEELWAERAKAANGEPNRLCRYEMAGRRCLDLRDEKLGNGYCTTHDALVASERARTDEEPAEGPTLRLVTNNSNPNTEGSTGVPVETATGGDVRNLEQVRAELDSIIREQEAEREDAQQHLQRAMEDAKRHQALQHWVETSDFPDDVRGAALALADHLRGLVDAAAARIAAADGTLNDARQALSDVDPHRQVKTAVDTAGGMAVTDAYAI